MAKTAKTIAHAIGYEASGRVKRAHRSGSTQAEAVAATGRTLARAVVSADGSGIVRILRDGEQIHFYEFGPE